MFVESHGVLEKFDEDQEKMYCTTCTHCDCTFHCQNQCPCRHILFIRQQADLPTFEITLFHSRYHKSGNNHSPSSPPSVLHTEFLTKDCVSLKFRTELRSRGRPKRSVRQLCSFNKSQADRGLQTDKKKPRKRKNTESFNRQSGVKKRSGSNDNCLVCDERLSHTDPDVVTTKCCSTLIHDDCSLEFSDCPQCN